MRNNASSLLSLKTLSQLFILFAIVFGFQPYFLTYKLSFEITDGHHSPSIPNNAVGGRVSSLSSSSDMHATDRILPDGTVTFTPEEFLAGRPERYVNLPNVAVDPDREEAVRILMEEAVPPPAETLLHEAPAPPGTNAIAGLASYPKFMDGWRKLVGSLRTNGYDGHIILGVNPAIPREERDYLDRMGVTYYAVEVADCAASILDGAGTTDNAVRAKCSRGLEDLKLEWGRYEMARRWLNACKTCSGWSMVIDTRDVFFQGDPFASLGDPGLAARDLLFVEEVASHTNALLPGAPHRATNIGGSRRYRAHVEPCYGREDVGAGALADRPMLCSGTVVGTGDGMRRFLSVLVDEFRTNNGRGPRCRSPATTDQWTMNHLYYKGKFGFARRTGTLPWGTGPVLTVGKPCVDSARKDAQSRKDMMAFDEATGLILNPHEGEGSAARVAATLHQYDRCMGWIKPWFKEHRQLYATKDRPEDEPAMPWVKGDEEAVVNNQ